jgi:hypothetical protein
VIAGGVALRVVDALEVVDVSTTRPSGAAVRDVRESSASSRCSNAPRLSAPVSESRVASSPRRVTSFATSSRSERTTPVTTPTMAATAMNVDARSGGSTQTASASAQAARANATLTAISRRERK